MSEILVIKVGGELFETPQKRSDLIAQLKQLQLLKHRVVLIHGGGPQITARAKELGQEAIFIKGKRVTDQAMMTLVQKVLREEINIPFVEELHAAGVKACTIDGALANLFEVEQEDPQLGLVGRVADVHAEDVSYALEVGALPVVTPLGVSRDGQVMNINADIAAGKLAAALQADKLVAVTNVRGLYRTFGDEKSFISTISFAEVEDLIAAGKINDGMLPKLEGVIEALRDGVTAAQIIDGRKSEHILDQINSNPPQGTLIIREVH